MPLSCDGDPPPRQLWTAAGVIMTSRLRPVYLNFKGGGERQRLIIQRVVMNWRMEHWNMSPDAKTFIGCPEMIIWPNEPFLPDSRQV